MRSVRFHCCPWIARAAATVRMPAAAGLALILACYGHGQVWRFSFDPNGNLQTEASEMLARPQILAQPQMQVVQPGELGSFFVLAADTSGLTYQWLFNG